LVREPKAPRTHSMASPRRLLNRTKANTDCRASRHRPVSHTMWYEPPYRTQRSQSREAYRSGQKDTNTRCHGIQHRSESHRIPMCGLAARRHRPQQVPRVAWPAPAPRWRSQNLPPAGGLPGQRLQTDCPYCRSRRRSTSRRCHGTQRPWKFHRIRGCSRVVFGHSFRTTGQHNGDNRHRAQAPRILCHQRSPPMHHSFDGIGNLKMRPLQG
jgi:hypothetical protein